MNSIFSRCGLSVLLWIFWAGSLAAQTTTNMAAGVNTPQEERVLVIVETSSVMQKRTENVQKLVGEIVFSGLGGDMRSGDTIGLWTFNDELRTGQFPLQRWTKTTRQRVAATVVQFLQQQPFEKTAKPAVFWDALTNIVARSERITVVIVSSGSDPIIGTPFDESITQNFLKNDDAQRKAKMPFITMLRAYQGKFISFSVNLPPWPMELPEYPKEARRAPEPAVAKPEPGATQTLPPPVIPVADHSPVYATNLPVVEPATEPTATNITSTVLDPMPSPTNVITATKPESTSQSPLQQNPEPQTEPVAKQETPMPVVKILVVGIALLIGILIVFLVLLRWTRRSSGESLITQTMNKKDE